MTDSRIVSISSVTTNISNHTSDSHCSRFLNLNHAAKRHSGPVIHHTKSTISSPSPDTSTSFPGFPNVLYQHKKIDRQIRPYPSSGLGVGINQSPKENVSCLFQTDTTDDLYPMLKSAICLSNLDSHIYGLI